MRSAAIVLGALFGLVILVGLFVWSSYNGLVTSELNVDNQWAQVEVQYQRRYDLVPNLVESVKGIFEQERAIITAVTEARTRYGDAVDPDAQAAAASDLDSALSRLLVIVENYPEIRSQQNVQSLMDELAGTENRIAVERARYNIAVTEFNGKLRRFPSNLVARMFGFERRTLYQSTTGADQPPPVRF
ncbi:MAG: LemA family protein [SAR202 cluster bacterium]|nr:LemA family protein [SAR202 cluster bacterium]